MAISTNVLLDEMVLDKVSQIKQTIVGPLIL